MAILNPNTLPFIKKAPKAFLGYARLHNNLVNSVRPVLSIRGGFKIGVSQSLNDTTISFKG
jgi:hypothetical protein